MSLHGNPVIETTHLPDGRNAHIRVGIAEDSYVADRLLNTVVLEVRVGRDLDVLEKLAVQVEKLLQGTPGTRDVENPLKVARTNLRLAVDPQKASLLGVPTVEFDRAVRLSVAGVSTGMKGPHSDVPLKPVVIEHAQIVSGAPASK